MRASASSRCNALYFVISATALGAVLVASRDFFVAVKWAGAAYLVYVGLSALFGRPSPITVSTAAAGSNAPRDLYLAGLTLQLANPKTLVFFVAILPQFVDARLAIRPQMIWLAAGSIIAEFCILAVSAGSRHVPADRDRSALRALDRPCRRHRSSARQRWSSA